ncbi:reverse transcriptase domain-containing protein [Tanacetum coccineum]
MNLNPKKCSFGVEEGPFLGHLITKQGIKANPSKVKAITDLKPPRTLKEIQSLNRKLAALSRFLSKGADRVLQGAELNYPELEKLILALVHAARRLQRYFQAHPVRVLADKPIKQILARPEKSGRIAKWAIKLGEHDIEFKGRDSIKGCWPNASQPRMKGIYIRSKERAERKRNEERDVALIEEAYYQNKLQRYHDTRSGRSTFSLGDFILLSGYNEDDHKQVRKGPHIISGDTKEDSTR